MTLIMTLLLAVALISLQLSRAGNGAVMSFLIIAPLGSGMIGIAAALFRRFRIAASAGAVRAGQIAIAAVLAGLFALAMLSPHASLAGEEVLLLALCGVASGLLICGSGERVPQQVLLLAGVIVIFSLPGVADSYRLALILTASALASCWLILSNPATLHSRTAWMYGSVVVLSIVGVCGVTHRWIKPADQNPWFAGWVASSGGDGAGDDNARRGTGDGPDEISGQASDSLGFDQSESFSESGREGLYDLWLESYGRPVNSAEMQKMVGLKPQDVIIVKIEDRENLKVGRAFEMRRERNASPSPAGRPDIAANAQLWVKGPLPAYVPLAVFKKYEASSWQEIPHGKASVPVRRQGESAWMDVLARPLSPAFDEPQKHQIRVGTLGGSILPLMPSTASFRMGRVSKPDFFSATRSGLVRLAQRDVPAGVVIDIVSKSIDPGRLMNVEPAQPRSSDAAALSVDSIDPRVRQLASSWGGDRDRGWRQIEQVIQRLRQNVVLDNTLSPADAEPIADLLLNRRRGTSYEIASAAVMVLRSLEYPTRLVSGFYAPADDVDERSGFVALAADDVHFWVEICLADGTWVTVDPTPGYPMLNLPRSKTEWSIEAWQTVRWNIGRYPLQIALILLMLVLLWVTRRQLIDAIATTICHLRGNRPQQVLQLIELRARLARVPRPASAPLGTWLMSVDSSHETRMFAETINRVLYAPSHTTNKAATSTEIAKRLTLKMFKRLNQGTTR